VCLSTTRDKFREVRTAIDGVVDASLKTRLEALFQRGAFRHDLDVAYAKILILRESKSDDDIVVELGDGYVDMGCDPVYPQ
jgi:hypothetical protein